MSVTEKRRIAVLVMMQCEFYLYREHQD